MYIELVSQNHSEFSYLLSVYSLVFSEGTCSFCLHCWRPGYWWEALILVVGISSDGRKYILSNVLIHLEIMDSFNFRNGRDLPEVQQRKLSLERLSRAGLWTPGFQASDSVALALG